MSLKSFHIFFITVSSALALFLVVWGFGGYRANGDPLHLGLGVVGVVVLLLLVPYSRWFWEKMKKLAPCAVCFGDPNSLLTIGAKWGVFSLGVIVGGVLLAIAWTAFTWARRAKLTPPSR